MNRFKNERDAMNICGNTKRKLLNCQQCTLLASRYRHDVTLDWSIALYCDECEVNWVVCRVCPVRVRMHKAIQVNRHDRFFHKETANSNGCNSSTMRATVRAGLAQSTGENCQNMLGEKEDTTTNDANEALSDVSHEGEAVLGQIHRSTNMPSLNAINVGNGKQDDVDIVTTTNVANEASSDVSHEADDVLGQEHGSPNMPSSKIINAGNEHDLGISSVTQEFICSPTADCNIRQINMGMQYLKNLIPTSNHTTSSSDSNGARISEYSQKFFNHHRQGNGKRYLVSLSQFGNDSQIGSIPEQDVNFYMEYAAMLKTLSGNDRARLGDLIKSFKDLLTNRFESMTLRAAPIYQIDHFPTSEREIRSRLFSNKHSLFRNYPIPRVHNNSAGHYYVLFSEAFSHYLELGGVIETPSMKNSGYPQNDLLESPRAQTELKLVQNTLEEDNGLPMISIFLCDWSDDFEPNYGSMNKGSVFLKTVTVLKSTNQTENVMNTFPLIIGKKDSDHSEVDKIIMDDIQQMKLRSHKYWSHERNEFVRIHPTMLTSLQDQPARRSYTCLMNGNGTYAARWGYACDWGSIAANLPMCEPCFEYMDNCHVQGVLWELPNCERCTNWSYKLDHPMLQHQSPTDYPLGPSKLSPRKLSFEVLKVIVDEVHRKIVSKQWTVKQGEIYLKTWAMSIKSINEITDRADNCSILQEITMREEVSDFANNVRRHHRENPNEYKQWVPPVSWDRQFGIDEYSNAIMHLISGICKTTSITCLGWIGRKYNLSLFNSRAQKMVTQLSQLGLGWFRLPPKFGGKFVGSLSENNINLGRCLPWIFSALPPIHDIPVHVDPQGPQNRWLKKDNINWLRIRGLDHEGNAEVVKRKVAEYMEMEDTPRPMSELVSDSIVPIRAVHSLCLLQSSIFMNSVQDAFQSNKLGVRVRLFLQHYSKVDLENSLTSKSNSHQTMAATPNPTDSAIDDTVPENEDNLVMVNHKPGGISRNRGSSSINSTARSKRKTKKKNPRNVPSWISSYNFMSLLNLEDEMNMIGPPRGHYEGSFRGEKIVSEMKPLITGGLTTGWAEHAMTNYWRGYVDKALVDGSFHSRERSVKQERTSRGKMLKVYPSLPQIQLLLGGGYAISGCIGRDERLYVAIEPGIRNESCRLVEITMGQDTGEYCGMLYSSISLISRDINELSVYSAVNIVDYCIFLPMVPDSPVFNHENEWFCYTYITHNRSDKMMALNVSNYR